MIRTELRSSEPLEGTISPMTLDNIIASIDAEIARLEQARALFSTETSNAGSATRKRRKLSPAARKRIAEAQRKRWAKQKAGK